MSFTCARFQHFQEPWKVVKVTITCSSPVSGWRGPGPKNEPKSRVWPLILDWTPTSIYIHTSKKPYPNFIPDPIVLDPQYPKTTNAQFPSYTMSGLRILVPVKRVIDYAVRLSCSRAIDSDGAFCVTWCIHFLPIASSTTPKLYPSAEETLKKIFEMQPN